MITNEKILSLTDRHDYLQHALGDPASMANDEFVKISKEYSDLTPIVEAAIALRDARDECFDLAEMISDGDDPEMKAMALEEMLALKETIPEIEKNLSVMLMPKDAADERPAILEIRAGTGGDEAALFAGDLYRMYEQYAHSKGWKFDAMSSSSADVGGFKEVVVSIKGTGVFACFKFESGVHRVQRVPTTESGGRIHTSAATVAVMPEPEEVDIVIKPEDLRIDTMRASGSGGQHVNTTDSAVRIVHIPTGIMVVSSEKSQHRNRDIAMQEIRARLYQHERDKVESEYAATRKDQVGSGDRSERIRTYNFPQGRVTDHRINLTLHKLDQVLAGEGLGEIIDALMTEDQALKLAAMEKTL